MRRAEPATAVIAMVEVPLAAGPDELTATNAGASSGLNDGVEPWLLLLMRAAALL